MASRYGAQTGAHAWKIGGAFLGAATAALMFAADARAQDQPQTANQLRYQFDAYYHIVYYSPEAFGCFRPGNQKNIGRAIAKTQQEIQLLSISLEDLTSAGSNSPDLPAIAAFTGMIAHLKEILFRLLHLPPCPEQPTDTPVTQGPPPDGGTGGSGNGGPDQNGGDDSVVPQGDVGGTGENGEVGQGASPCWPGSNASDQGNCPQDQYGLNRPNQHGDNGNGHHNNH